MPTPILDPKTKRPAVREPARRGRSRRRSRDVPTAAPAPPAHGNRSQLPGLILAIGALLLVAAGVGMRLYALGDHPRGLWYDEAMYALDAVRVLGGDHPLYFPANGGREPLFIYLAAATIHWFGHTPLGIRAAALICGLLTLGAAYLLGLAWGNRRVGLLCAAIMAVMLWHVHLSRVGFRVVSLPLFVTLALALGAMALRSRARWLLVAAGVASGLCFYTYLAARLTPIALLAMGAYGCIWHRVHLRGRGRDLAWMLGAALFVALPLAIYALGHREIFFARGDEVAVWSGSLSFGDALGALRNNLTRVLGMFIWRGDGMPRHNVPGRPILDPLLAVPFLGGVAMAIVGWRRRPAWALSLIWIATMSLPTLLSGSAPHFLRAAGLLPAVALLPALTLEEWIRRRENAARSAVAQPAGAQLARWNRIVPTLAAAGTVALLAASAALTARDYFGTRPPTTFRLSGFDYAGCYRTDLQSHLVFQADLLDLAGEIETSKRPTVLYERLHPTLEFLAPHAARFHTFLWKEQPPVVPPPFALLACPGYQGPSLLDVLPPSVRVTVLPSPCISRSRRESRGPRGLAGEAYVRWDVDPLGGASSSGRKPLVSFEDGLTLRSVEPAPGGSTLQLRLCWTKEGGRSADAELQAEVLDPAGRPLGDLTMMPGTIYYDPSHWTAGSEVVHTELLTLGRAGAEPSQLRLRLRDPNTGAEVPIRTTTARRQGETILLPLGS